MATPNSHWVDLHPIDIRNNFVKVSSTPKIIEYALKKDVDGQWLTYHDGTWTKRNWHGYFHRETGALLTHAQLVRLSEVRTLSFQKDDIFYHIDTGRCFFSTGLDYMFQEIKYNLGPIDGCFFFAKDGSDPLDYSKEYKFTFNANTWTWDKSPSRPFCPVLDAPSCNNHLDGSGFFGDGVGAPQCLSEGDGHIPTYEETCMKDNKPAFLQKLDEYTDAFINEYPLGTQLDGVIAYLDGEMELIKDTSDLYVMKLSDIWALFAPSKSVPGSFNAIKNVAIPKDRLIAFMLTQGIDVEAIIKYRIRQAVKAEHERAQRELEEADYSFVTRLQHFRDYPDCLNGCLHGLSDDDDDDEDIK